MGETFVHNSTVVVNGTANEIYCGGYTENASAKATVGQANLKVYGWYSKFGLGLGAGQSYLLTPVGCYQELKTGCIHAKCDWGLFLYGLSPFFINVEPFSYWRYTGQMIQQIWLFSIFAFMVCLRL